MNAGLSPLILNVDDYEPARHARSLVLRQAGFRVEEARSGAEALRLAAGLRPDLVLLDVNLPDMTGFEVCQGLRAGGTPWVPVLHISATFVTPAHAARGLEEGADAYLVEPVAPSVLIATVNAFLRLRRAEERERVARAAAEEASRAKDRFLAVLAHEVRNPLGPILNALEMIRRRASSDAGVLEAVSMAERPARHLARLLDDLLDLSRLSRGAQLRRQPVDICHVVSQVLDTYRAVIEASHLGLSVSLEPAGVVVDGDPDYLAQIAANLVGNATKYTPPGGTIEVVVSAPGDEALIQVKDNGIGIAPGVLPRIFEMFTQGDTAPTRARGGLGIGLAVVRQLVELHGGAVDATSEGQGRGSCFTVRLPRSRHQISLGGTEPGRERGLRRRRVLIIEHGADSREALGAALTSAGLEVETAADGPAGLDRAVRYPPDVVLVDLGLPGMDGYEVAQRLRDKLGSRVRLIALAGSGQADHRLRSREAGFDVHMLKPVAAEDLLSFFGP